MTRGYDGSVLTAMEDLNYQMPEGQILSAEQGQSIVDIRDAQSGIGSTDRSNTIAGAVGGGMQASGEIVSGILSGMAVRNARENAEAQTMQDIAQARIDRESEYDALRQQDALDKERAMWNNSMANAGLRLELFQRDINKRMQEAADGKAALDRLRNNVISEEAMQTVMARQAGGIK